MKEQTKEREEITWHAAHYDKLTYGELLADKVANTMGSWRFIIWQTLIVIIWISLNIVGFLYHFDPFPFIFLNLFLSLTATYSAPVIMMAQNRQSARDRVHTDHRTARWNRPYCDWPFRESSTQNDTLAFESLQCGIGLTGGDARARGHHCGRDRPARFEQTAHHGDSRFGRFPIVTDLGGNSDDRIKRRVGKCGEHGGDSLCRRPGCDR